MDEIKKQTLFQTHLERRIKELHGREKDQAKILSQYKVKR